MKKLLLAATAVLALIGVLADQQLSRLRDRRRARQAFRWSARMKVA
jgi:hypothetical protein